MKQSNDPPAYMEYVNSAKKHIKEHNFEEAKNILLKAIVENVESPVAYNLFGALYEYSRDKSRAVKFYRVAYYFDQTYAPARNNLERATTFEGRGLTDIDFGEEDNTL